MTDKIISIVTPSLNQAKYIAATIESVLSQSGDFFIDYIIMDGGSNDGAVDIIKHYETELATNCDVKSENGLDFYIRKDQSYKLNQCFGISYRWVSEKDKGTADAINKGIAIAKGEIFSYLNSDDVLEPFALQAVSDTFSEYPDMDVIYGNAFYIDSVGNVKNAYPVEDFDLNKLYTNCFISQPSAFIKIAKIREVGDYNINIHNSLDYEYWLQLAVHGAKFKFIRNLLSSTRIHQDAKTSRNQKVIHFETLAISQEYNGSIPFGWKFSFTRNVSIVSKVLNVLMAIGKKISTIIISLYTPIYCQLNAGKIEAMRRKIFVANPGPEA